jgi:hypothetical protein
MMHHNNSLIEVPEDYRVEDASCSVLARDELFTFSDFVRCRDPHEPTAAAHVVPTPARAVLPTPAPTVIAAAQEPMELPKELIMALDELITCGEFFGCRDPEPPVQTKKNEDGDGSKPDPPAANDLFGNIYTIESRGGMSCSNVHTGSLCVIPSPSAQVQEAVYEHVNEAVYNEDCQSLLPEEKEPLIMIVDEDDSPASVCAVRDDNSSISYRRRSPMHLSYRSSMNKKNRSSGRVVAARTVTTTTNITTAVREDETTANSSNNYTSTGGCVDPHPYHHHRYDVADTDTVRAVAPRKNVSTDDDNNCANTVMSSTTNKVMIVVVRRPRYTTTTTLGGGGHAE